MIQWFFNLAALLAAAMTLVQPGIEICSPDTMGREALSSNDRHRHAGSVHMHGHEHHDHAHHHHLHGLSSKTSGGSHEHGSDEGPCHCGPQKLPDATLPAAVLVSAPGRNFLSALHAQLATAIARLASFGGSPTAQPPPGYARASNAIALSQGNPCALFCRWVI